MKYTFNVLVLIQSTPHTETEDFPNSRWYITVENLSVMPQFGWRVTVKEFAGNVKYIHYKVDTEIIIIFGNHYVENEEEYDKLITELDKEGWKVL